MINRILVAVFIGFFASICTADQEADAIQAAAEQALEAGDTEGALDNYMTLIELAPENGEALESAAVLAAEVGILELAIEMWVRRADLAANQADRDAIIQANSEISSLHNLVPSWIEEKVAQASQYTEDDVEVVQMWQEMVDESQAAVEADDAEAAVAAQEGALFLVQEAFGETHWLTLTASRDLGLLYFRLGMAAEAENYYSKALAAAEQALGEAHPNTLEVSELMATLYNSMGIYKEAQMMLEMVAAGYESSLGAGHDLTVNARLSEVENLKSAGSYGPAMESLLGLYATVELNFGPYHPQSFNCLLQVADLQQTLGQLDEAESTYRQAVARMSVASGVNADTLTTLAQIAELYRVAGRYQEAKDLLSAIIQTALQIGEIEGSFVARSYLGRVFDNEGDYDKAQLVTEEVLEYGIQAWQDVPLQVYNTLLALGGIYQGQGKLSEAEASYEEVMHNVTELLGENHPTALVAANNLGQILEQGGLYDQAEPIIKETLSKMEAAFGEDHPDTMRVRSNLGLIHESQGNFRESEPLYRKSLDMLAAIHGENHTDTIAVKNNLAYLYMLMEEFDQSAQIFQEVQQQWIALFGDDHQNSLKATNNLGRAYHKQGKLTEAEIQITRALELRRSVLGPDHIDSIRSMIDLGGLYIDRDRGEEARQMLTDALKLAEDILGYQHPYTFDALNLLAQAIENANQLQAAVDLRDVGFRRRSEFLDTMLWATGENGREGYVRLHRPEFNRYMILLARLGDEKSAKRMIEASLQRKGLLLKVTSEIQQITTMTTNPKLKGLATEFEETRRELAALTLSGPTAETKGRHTEALYEVEQRVNELQGELGRASIRYRASIAKISSDGLADALPDGAALVDFLVFEDQGQDKLLAAVLSKQGGEVSYELIEYGDRKSVDDVVVEYRTMIQDDLADEDELLEVGMMAYEMVWEPIEEALQGSEYAYLIPDGMLNILPFNALVDQDESYLIQTVDLHILTSGRDLLPNEFRLTEGEYLVLAGPDYDSNEVVSDADMEVAKGRRSSALKLGIRGAGSGLRGLSFAPLPGAEEEGRIIVDQVASSNTVSENFFGASAQEMVLGALEKPPEILHIATHGFFLEADETLRKRILKAQRSAELHVPPPGDNPLLRAGLAFAGINTNAQFLGDIDTTNDGVLTALEVLDLNLSGTKLVVLSACETGLGEIHEGEGVYGLRRSFQEAGVAEVVSSLWEVSDAGTQALMTEFYDKLLSGVPAREALREVQLDLIDSPEWGYPYIWSAFMIVGSYESSGVTVQ